MNEKQYSTGLDHEGTMLYLQYARLYHWQIREGTFIIVGGGGGG